MHALLLLASAIVPALLILWYVYSRDDHPEPRGVVLKTFLLGAVICIPVVPVAASLEKLGVHATGFWSKALVAAFLGAAIPEECFKFLVLRGWVWKQKAFDEPMDGIVYGATASLGFAALENVLYVGSNGFGNAILRAFTAVPGHAMTGVVMGAFAGRARFSRPPGERLPLLAAGLLAAIALHGAYDTFLMTESAWALLALPVLGVELLVGRRLIAVMHAEQALLPAPALVVDDAPNPLAPGLAAPGAVPLRPRRTVGANAKLVAGGAAATVCAAVLAMLIGLAFEKGTPDAPAAPLGGLVLIALVVSPIGLFALRLFRSGLHGPFVEEPARVWPDGA